VKYLISHPKERTQVFENGTVRMCDLETDDVAERWRKLHSEVVHNLYTSVSNSPVRIRWAGHIERMGEMRIYI
jgi:hypothetical protein